MTTIVFPTPDNKQTFEAEASRLAESLLPQPARTVIDIDGTRRDMPQKTGIQVGTDTWPVINAYLSSPDTHLTPSQFWFIIRCCVMRFGRSLILRENLTAERREEYDMLCDDVPDKVDLDWLGEVGYTNKVRLDGALDEPKVKLMKKRKGKRFAKKI